MAAKGQRKTYPPELVAKITELYASGQTLKQVGASVGFSLSGVSKIMERSGIPRRPSGLRLYGSDHPLWKGDHASYTSLHERVERARGKPQHCTRCQASGPGRQYHWANLTGNYADTSDYERMCKSCHQAFDAERRKNGTHVGREAFSS